MKTGDIKDELFRQAVEAIDSGDIAGLKELIEFDPNLVRKPLQTADEEGYFKNPYLLWFVADNPIRNSKLAPNIIEVIALLVEAVKHLAIENAQTQLDYTLDLILTGRTARESGKQLALMDVLINAGAARGSALAALANGNIEAAKYLSDRGEKLTLPVAVGLGRSDDIDDLQTEASSEEKLTALTVAAFYGMAAIVAQFIEARFNPNSYPPKGCGFHSHATPLHQAVSSGSLATVRILAAAGADLTARDKIYHGTPLEWANYMQRDEDTPQDMLVKYKAIEDYLRSL